MQRLPEDLLPLSVHPGDPNYERARQLWNGAVDHRPALIVRPRDAAQVAAALGYCGEEGLPVSILGGGYDWAGRSMREGAVVIDLSAIADVATDTTAGTVDVGGGARSSRIMEALSATGTAVVTGAVGGVGIAGFTLGGGYGPTMPGLGLGIDNLVAAEVVLADGNIVHADDTRERELMWALRGGGGNFGVVTKMTLRLHKLEQILAGKIVYPWAHANKVLAGWNDVMNDVPDQLGCTAALVSGPDGKPVVALAPCWQGSLDSGVVGTAPLLRVGTPVATMLEPMPPASLFKLFEAGAVPRRRYAQQTRWLPWLGADAIDALIEAIENRPSPLSAIAVQSFHGAPTRVSSSATAFGTRQRHFLVSIVAAWEEHSGEADLRNQRWARQTSNALARHALPGGYANLLGPDETGQLAHAYGNNLERLRAIKRRLDPQGRFNTNGPIDL